MQADGYNEPLFKLECFHTQQEAEKAKQRLCVVTHLFLGATVEGPRWHVTERNLTFNRNTIV